MTQRERFRVFPAWLALAVLGWVMLAAASPAAARSAGTIAVDSTGSVYVTGRAGLDRKYVAAIKYQHNTQAWVKTYFTDFKYYDSLETPLIKLDKSGNVYVADLVMGADATVKCLLLKYTAQGIVVWAKTAIIPGTVIIELADLALDPAGNIYLAAKGYSSGYYRSFLFKYTPEGTLERTFNSVDLLETANTHFEAAAMGVDALGYVYLTGRFYDNKNQTSLFFTFKLSPTAKKVWARYLGFSTTGAFYNTPKDLAVDGSGNVFVFGEATGGQYQSQFLILQKYDYTGKPAGRATYNYPGVVEDRATAITLGPYPNVYLTGHSPGNDIYSPEDTLVIKTNFNCVKQWLKKYHDKTTAGLFPVAIAANAAGVAVSACSSNYVTMQYNSDGSLKWVKSYDGGAGLDSTTGVTTDKSGNVFVTGISAFNNGIRKRANDLTTIKYTSTGAVAPGWPRRYPVP